MLSLVCYHIVHLKKYCSVQNGVKNKWGTDHLFIYIYSHLQNGNIMFASHDIPLLYSLFFLKSNIYII